MAENTNPKIKFGVVHTSPASLITNAASLEEGKLYFAAGDASGVVKQGVYGVVGLTTDGSIVLDGTGTDKTVAMFGTGAIADGNGYGLSQANFTTDEKNKLAGIAANANNYSLPLANSDNRGGIQVGFIANDASIPVQLSGEDAYVQLTKTSIEKGLGYTINASVPSDAKFTDTDTWRAIKVNGTQQISNNTSTALDISAGNNIDVSFISNKVVIAAKNVDASNADHATNATNASTADKVAQSFDVSFDGADILSFNGSANKTLAFKEGSNIDITNSNGTLTIATTGVPTISDMSTAIDNKIAAALTSALKYKGTVDGSNYTTKLNVSNANTGDVYVANASFTTTTDYTTNAYSIEVGDYFIFNGTKFDVVGGENQVENKDATLGVGSKTNIAVIDGSTISVALPPKGDAYYTHPLAGNASQSLGNESKNTTVTIGTETKIATIYDVSFDASGHYKGKVARDISINITSDNTDEKVKANTSDGKFYLIGQDDATNGATETAYKNASVYVEGGYLYSGNAQVLTSYSEQYQGTVKWIYPGTGLTNGTTDSSITTTGTLNLKIASSSEIGGVKPGTTIGKTYGVQVNASTGEMTVNVPWTNDNDNTWRDVYVGGTQRLTTGTNSGSLKFVDGTNIKATWDSSNKTIQFDASGLATTTQVEAATIYWETL